MLDAGKEFGRYLDVDGDGIPFRTYPGTHPSKGGYFTRGTSKNAYAAYSEAGPDYKYNMQRLLKKFETAKTLGAQARAQRFQGAGSLRRDLLRLDESRDGRGAGRARAPG